MKYKDLITLFTFIGFILSIGYTLGVNNFFWFVPIILFVVLIFIYYYLWK